MSDQTPEARLAAALPISVIDHATEHDVVVRGRYTLDASMMRERLVAGMTAADPTLAADLALAAAVREWRREHPTATFMPIFVVQTAAKEVSE